MLQEESLFYDTNSLLTLPFSVGGINVESGTTVQATVLDVSRLDHLVELSLKSEFVYRPKDEGSDKAPKKVLI